MTPEAWIGLGALAMGIIAGIYNIIKLVIKAQRADELEKEVDYLKKRIDEKNDAILRLK